MNGQALRRTESFTNPNYYPGFGAPREVWYRFAGKQLGYVGNNGTLETDYWTSVRSRTQAAANGPFRSGTDMAHHANFDLSGEPITSFDQGGSGGSYTARNGDTLASVAAQLWGDSSLWYKLAEANGMSGASALIEGQRITIPPGIVRSGHNASTLKPYDPLETAGDLSPSATASSLAARPPKRNKCGMFGQILLVVVAVAVTALVAGPAAGLAGSKILGGAMAGAAGAIASQGVGLATGLQEKFSFKQVAMSALSGAAAAGVGQVVKGALAGSKFLGDLARGAATSAVTQSVGVMTGLQSKFDFAGVAAAGLGAGVSGGVGRALPGAANSKLEKTSSFFNQLGSNTAGGIANAAVRTVANGTSFGDNLMAALPDVIGNTIGNAIGKGIAKPFNEKRIARLASSDIVPEDIRGTPAAAEMIRDAVEGGASNRDIRKMLRSEGAQDYMRDRRMQISADKFWREHKLSEAQIAKQEQINAGTGFRRVSGEYGFGGPPREDPPTLNGSTSWQSEGRVQRPYPRAEPRVTATAPAELSPEAQRRLANEFLLTDPRILAVLDMIAYAEGSNYDTLFGGTTFRGFQRHPGHVGAEYRGQTQSAAGRYQIQKGTFDEVSRRLGITDFSPHSQDLMAVERLRTRGAIPAILAGDLAGALRGLSREWASLPYLANGRWQGRYGQPLKSFDQLQRVHTTRLQYHSTLEQALIRMHDYQARRQEIVGR